MTAELIHKAKTALSSARLLLAAGDGDGATNRAYYAMFDAATAALLSNGAASPGNLPKSHGGLISAVGQHLVQTGKLPIELGRSLNRIHELRLTADYLAGPVPLDKAGGAIEEAETFVLQIEELLTRSGARGPDG
jgi:uncharacterized protein (UPF0332 family)